MRVLAVLAFVCFPAVVLSGEAQRVSSAHMDKDSFIVHTVTSEFQSGQTKVKVLLPDGLQQGRRYPVLYVLPVEPKDGTHWGDGLLEVKQHDLHNEHGLICVMPTFSHVPWYANHPSNNEIRQERYFLKIVLPFIDRTYPTIAKREGRLLVGFSKSGWGAFSLLLRHPEVFGKAAAWDAPLMMQRPNKYGMGEIFGTQENFEEYQVSALLRRKGAMLGDGIRLIHFGYGGFREHHRSAHRLMNELKVAHQYRDGPQRKHSWHSGWLSEAVQMLVSAEKEKGDITDIGGK